MAMLAAVRSAVRGRIVRANLAFIHKVKEGTVTIGSIVDGDRWQGTIAPDIPEVSISFPAGFHFCISHFIASSSTTAYHVVLLPRYLSPKNYQDDLEPRQSPKAEPPSPREETYLLAFNQATPAHQVAPHTIPRPL